MKKSVLIAFALLLSLNTMSFAQKKWSEDTKNELQSKRGEVSPATRAKMQTKEMTLALDLTDNQQKDVETALLDFHTELKDVKASMQKSYDDMSTEEKQELKSKHLDAQIALKREMKTILDEKQYEKFSAKMTAGKRKMKKAYKRKRK